MHELSKAASRGPLSLRAVLRASIVFGYYCSCSARAERRLLCRLYCCCFASTILLTICMLTPKGTGFKLVYSVVLEYVIEVCLSLITEEKKFFTFCKTIELADRKMGYENLVFLSPAIQYMFMFIIGIYLFTFIGVFFAQNIDIVIIYTTTLLVIGLAIILHSIIHVCSLDMMRHRFSLLTCHFKSIFNQNGSGRIDTMNGYKIEATIDCLKLYKTLVDNLNAVLLWAKDQILTRLGVTFMLFIHNGYKMIQYVTEGNGTIARTIVELVVTSVPHCLPAVFGELVIREVENFRKAIGDELIISEDPELCSALELAADYLELRACRVTVCRVWGLDATLVLNFVSLCTNSLLIFVQITGLILEMT